MIRSNLRSFPVDGRAISVDLIEIVAAPLEIPSKGQEIPSTMTLPPFDGLVRRHESSPRASGASSRSPTGARRRLDRIERR
jgi:hypothetical protein